MKKFSILAGNKAHYTSLIKDYRKYMNLVTYTETLAELETMDGGEFVAIYNRDEMTAEDIKKIFG
jgi:hypothetical protein